MNLKWSGDDAHVELESLASKLISGPGVHGHAILEADEIKVDQLSISGGTTPLEGDNSRPSQLSI